MTSDLEVNCDKKSSEQQEDAKLPIWRKRRFQLITMIFVGLFCFYSLRVIVSIAIVAMTKKFNTTSEDGTVIEDQHFDWDSKLQGYILSSFYYGYITTQLLGGFLGSRFGGTLVIGIGIGFSAILALLTPLAAKVHYGLFITVRVLQGCFNGVVVPSVFVVLSLWVPVSERARIGNIAFTGIYIGTIGANLLSGILSETWGWESIFYFFGTFTAVWYMLWILVIRPSPDIDPFITQAEKNYIISSIGERTEGRKIKHPIKDIFTSLPVWSVVVGYFTSNYMLFSLLTLLPMFVNDTMNFNIGTTGILSAIPYIPLIILPAVAGYLTDWVQVKGYLRTGQVRRWCNSVPFMTQMVFMLLTAFATDPTLSLVYITIAAGAASFPCEQQEDAKLPIWRKRRFHLVTMIFLGIFCFYSLRVNVSIAIVAMTKKFNTTSVNGTVIEDQHFDWDSKQQGYILSSFYYGYITTQLLGGFLGSRFGGTLMIGIGIGSSAILALLTPLAAKVHYGLFITVRVLQGCFNGVIAPSIFVVWSLWVPVSERSIFGNIACTGIYVGTIGANLLSGILIVTLGWESIFYFFGTVTGIWYILWLLVIRPSPDVDPFITQAEKNYIISSIGERTEGRKIKHPIKDIFTSLPVWSVVVGNFTALYILYSLLNLLPKFLNDTMNYNMGTTGNLSAVPYIPLIGLPAAVGYLADWVQVKGYLRTGQVRRWCNSAAFMIQMVFMLLTAFATDPTLSLVYITIAAGAGALPWSGYLVNPLDLAPSHASIIIGLSNTFGTLAGILSPILMGYIVTDKTREQWQIMFYITAGICLFGSVFCFLFTRGKLQPWAKVDQEKLLAKKFQKEITGEHCTITSLTILNS
ncbi:MFS domain-containing protein [Sergentomyia squamirostris]